ncbi:hypothetical protein V1525DRAFT_391945 [Lipomyces kononenkoae]|uniref:Uncharacterized protein n=1 Tax=Lipomyces kononenkoae TaxID=34357 RepID=A0ACC3SQN9_LIPKO
MSSTITKSVFKYDNYTDDVKSIMDERANLGDVMLAHLSSRLSTIQDYAKHGVNGPAGKHGSALPVKLLSEDGRQLPRTPAKVIKVMSKYIWLVAALDFAVSVRGTDDDRAWNRRKRRAVRHSTFTNVVCVEFILPSVEPHRVAASG